MKKLYCIISSKENPIIVSIENLKNLKYHAFRKKFSFFEYFLQVQEFK